MFTRVLWSISCTRASTWTNTWTGAVAGLGKSIFFYFFLFLCLDNSIVRHSLTPFSFFNPPCFPMYLFIAAGNMRCQRMVGPCRRLCSLEIHKIRCPFTAWVSLPLYSGSRSATGTSVLLQRSVPMPNCSWRRNGRRMCAYTSSESSVQQWLAS